MTLLLDSLAKHGGVNADLTRARWPSGPHVAVLLRPVSGSSPRSFTSAAVWRSNTARSRPPLSRGPNAGRRAPSRGPASQSARCGSPDRSVYEPGKPFGMRDRCAGGGADKLRGGLSGEPRPYPGAWATCARSGDHGRPPARRELATRRRPTWPPATHSPQQQNSAPDRSRARSCSRECPNRQKDQLHVCTEGELAQRPMGGNLGARA